MKRDSTVKTLTTTALMAATIFVVTYLVKIPLPTVSGGGYLNLGDTFIYIAAALLGGPGGAIAAAAGSALSDLALGYVIYILPTAIVKGLMGLICGKLMEREGFLRFMAASVIGGAVMVIGYAMFETLFFNLNQALAGAPFNMVQWVCGVVAAIAVYPAILRIKNGVMK